MQQKPNMIYTPNRHIPIGEAIKNPDGTLAIRIKGTAQISTMKYRLIHFVNLQ